MAITPTISAAIISLGLLAPGMAVPALAVSVSVDDGTVSIEHEEFLVDVQEDSTVHIEARDIVVDIEDSSVSVETPEKGEE